MEQLRIKADEVTPQIIFDHETGILEMKGTAVPEDVWELFNPIKGWLEKYFKDPKPSTELILFFDYLNTSASKMVYQVCDMVSDLHGNEHTNVKITWKYYRGDVEMHELGEEIMESLVCFKEIVAVERVL